MVPDFLGPEAAIFEARTLLFLAAWLEHVGPNPALPLHLACIGEPPARVQRLAARSGAVLSIHAPVGAEQRGFSNKLRGFEVARRTDFLLLVDADVMVLGDPSPILDLGYCVALSPADQAKVPARFWDRIYPGLGLPMPSERMLSTLGESMPPYYNGGVVYAPWACGLGAIWEDHVRRIARLFVGDEPHARAVHGSDQAGLATAVASLRGQGVPVVPLPWGFNVRWQHLYSHRVRPDQIALFHATGLYRRGHGRRVLPGLWGYEQDLLGRVLQVLRRRAGVGTRVRPRHLASALVAVHRIVAGLRRLHQEYLADDR
jgi:hypothetical protein